jgi:hypothetical protein
LIHNQPPSIIGHNHRAQSSTKKSSIIITQQCLPAAELNRRENFKGGCLKTFLLGSPLLFWLRRLCCPSFDRLFPLARKPARRR